MKSKTFRLFISSTFSDFQKEREALQTRVFPDIKEYCNNLGYVFQAIDLRWGVTHEAQLDQKTLELCLNEVKTCKSYPHPNFLIMIGDRYGWIPLPYAIEKSEFEKLIRFIPLEQKALILEWYKEDLNQIPTSYILKERKDKYEEHEEWHRVENLLRDYFQNAVNQSGLDHKQISKYFLSATEAEVQERILGYQENTFFINKIPSTEGLVDNRYIFGFFRNVDKESVSSEKFVSKDFKLAQIFRDKVKSHLVPENTLSVNTIQLNNELLDETYLELFIEKTTKFLKSKFDEQKYLEKKLNLTSLDIELREQKYFLTQKVKNFHGQIHLRERIREYIRGNSTESLILSGKSGMGKSSIMAKAIEEAQLLKNKKILYRFIGSTPNSSSTKEILISLFEELGKDVSKINEFERANILPNQNLETFEDFCTRIHNEIRNIIEDVVIFIDAVDQLINDDEFLWLPEHLPSNIKIIISALDDENYIADSLYFESLKEKSNYILELLPYEEPMVLLSNLLKQNNRTLQHYQKQYFLTQYAKVKSPLYIIVAAEELRHWKSYDLIEGQEKKENSFVIRNLAESQQGIINEYINNLHSLYHHEYIFIQRVLSFICASRDGLGENEILELLSTDYSFVKKMAPETWHKNPTQELPIIFWARIYSMISPFLGIRQKDGEELIYFFHREFEKSLSSNNWYEEEFNHLIKNIKKNINKSNNLHFSNRRFGKILVIVTIHYFQQFNNKSIFKEITDFVFSINNNDWQLQFYKHLEKIGVKHSINNTTDIAKLYLEWGKLLSERILKDHSEEDNTNDLQFFEWMKNYQQSNHYLSSIYSSENQYDKYYEAIFIAHEISKKIYEHFPNKGLENYILISCELAYYYYQTVKTEKSIELLEELMNIYENQENDINRKYLYAACCQVLALNYTRVHKTDQAILHWEKGIKYVKSKIRSRSNEDTRIYVSMLIDYSRTLFYIRNIDDALIYAKSAHDILELKYRINKKEWVQYYLNLLSLLGNIYLEIRELDKCEKIFLESYKILKHHYSNNQDRWRIDYILDLVNLGNYYRGVKKYEKAIIVLNEALSIIKPSLNNSNNDIVIHYSKILNNLGLILLDTKEEIQAIKHLTTARKTLKVHYEADKLLHGDLYSTILNNLGMCYSSLNLFEKSVAFYKESLSIRENLFNLNPDRFKENYLIGLSNTSREFSRMKLGNEAVPLLYRILSLIKDIHNNSLIYKQIYIITLHDLSFHSFDENSPTISISLLETGKQELKELSQKDKQWGQMLIKFIKALINLNKILNNHEQVYLLNLELENITKYRNH